MRQDVLNAVIHVTNEMNNIENIFQRFATQMSKNEQETVKRYYKSLTDSRTQLLQIPDQVSGQQQAVEETVVDETPQEEDSGEPESSEPTQDDRQKKKKGKNASDFF